MRAVRRGEGAWLSAADAGAARGDQRKPRKGVASARLPVGRANGLGEKVKGADRSW